MRKPEKSVAEIRVGTKVLAFLSRTHWQILIAILVTAATLLLHRQWRGANAFPLQFTLSDYLALLGLVGGILALAGSIAFGFLLYFVSDATNRKCGYKTP